MERAVRASGDGEVISGLTFEPPRCARHPLQVPRRVHACVKNADDGDAVVFSPEIGDMSLDGCATVTSPDVIAVWCLFWSIGEHRAGVLDHLRVTHGLFQPLLPHGVVEQLTQIALRGWAESVFGHV